MDAHIQTVALLGGTSFERGVAVADVPEYLADPHNVVWLDVTDPGPAEQALLVENFGCHPLTLQDRAVGHRRPKLVEYKDHVFAVVYTVAAGPQPVGQVRLTEVALFVGPNYLVTVHGQPVPALDEALQRWQARGALLAEGAGYLLYLVLDTLTHTYPPVVDGLGEALAQVELGLVHGPTEKRVPELLDIRRDVFQLRRVLYPTREVFGILIREERPLVAAATQVYLHDVHDHVLRLLDLLDVHREMVAGSLDASLTLVSNRLNQTMKRLTVLSAVLGLVACVLSAWGMNVGDIPLETAAHGFAWVVGATSAAAAAILIVGWRRGWL